MHLICARKSQRQMLEYHLNAFGCWLAQQTSWLALVAGQAQSPSPDHYVVSYQYVDSTLLSACFSPYYIVFFSLPPQTVYFKLPCLLAFSLLKWTRKCGNMPQEAGCRDSSMAELLCYNKGTIWDFLKGKMRDYDAYESWNKINYLYLKSIQYK